jgi:ferredoxin
VDAFFEGPNFLVIDPDICIDCELCVPECPADAIVQDEKISPDQAQFLELNAELAKQWPNINEIKPAPADADKWNGVANKIPLLLIE